MRKWFEETSDIHCPVTRKIGFCAGGSGIAEPESALGGAVVPAATFDGSMHSNWVDDNPVAITVIVCEFNCVPGSVVSPETETCSPGVNVFAEVNVTIPDAI